MKLRYKILYMSFGAGLVVLGMVLNSLVSGDADAQGDVENGVFGDITCRNLTIKNGALFIKDEYKERGYFGLDTNSNAMLTIHGDDGISTVAYLGVNEVINDEMVFYLQSKSKTNKGMVKIQMTPLGGMVGCVNNMGKTVAGVAVGPDGDGHILTTDKYGYVE